MIAHSIRYVQKDCPSWLIQAAIYTTKKHKENHQSPLNFGVCEGKWRLNKQISVLLSCYFFSFSVYLSRTGSNCHRLTIKPLKTIQTGRDLVAGVTLCYCHAYNIVLQCCWSCTFILPYSFCNLVLSFSYCRHQGQIPCLYKVDSDNMRPIIQRETFHLGCQFILPVCPLCVTMLGEMGEQKRTTLLCPLMSSFHTDRLKVWRHDMQFVYLKAWGTIVLCRSLVILKCQFPFSIYLWNFFGLFLLQFFCHAFPAAK